jgi:hypothetical protein
MIVEAMFLFFLVSVVVAIVWARTQVYKKGRR